MLSATRHLTSRAQRNPAQGAAPTKALTIVEVMTSVGVMAMVMTAVLTTFIQSRRVTEASVLHGAATSLVYGLIEQIKHLDYATHLPSYEVDPFAPNTITPPYVRVRINQSSVRWLKVVHTPVPAPTVAVPNPVPTPMAPTTRPSASATPASLGATQNLIGSIPLSTITGTASQEINLDIWIWIDDIPSVSDDVTEVKKVTIVYTYEYQDGGRTRTVRDWDVFIRTRFEQ